MPKKTAVSFFGYDKFRKRVQMSSAKKTRETKKSIMLAITFKLEVRGKTMENKQIETGETVNVFFCRVEMEKYNFDDTRFEIAQPSGDE